ncbi:MAG: OmpH family outer membrane protein [Prevotellaceae bacterium]|jgi:outer membrane protein|nr:OmpH family outer membrane protein [Prevotellaceae bacterium]
MKKGYFVTISTPLLLVAVAVLFFLVLGGKKLSSSSEASSAGGAQALAESGVVFVNIDSLVRGYDMYFDLQKEFEAAAKKKDGDFTAKMRKFESDARDFQEKVEKGLVTRSQAQQLQEGLAARQQEMQQLQQQLQMELAEEEGVMLRQIQSNIQEYIKVYNAEKSYSLILSTSGSTVVLYGNPALNITDEVLKGLNESYVKARKK